MSLHTIKKGLDLPLAGAPTQEIDDAAQPGRVALVAADYIGMKPTMHVQPGDSVRRGQLLFEDKKTPRVRYTAPGGGTVQGVHRGDRRALVSVVIDLDETERGGGHDCVTFESYGGVAPADLTREQAVDLLVESGMWTTIRQRPFSRIANPEETPAGIVRDGDGLEPACPRRRYRDEGGAKLISERDCR